jgi:formylglycine-generating enzyme required for sulfatase activity
MWYKAVEFCNFRSEREGLTPVYEIDKAYMGPPSRYRYDKYAWRVRWNREAGMNGKTAGYRLPTSAEWEYACRAGTLTDYYTGDVITEQDACINCDSPMPVGSFPPNPWGLCDMYGNVSEWCWDFAWRNYEVGLKELIDPAGPDEGFLRVHRGGSHLSDHNRHDGRYFITGGEEAPYPWFRPYIGPIGFRLVRGRADA